MVPPTVYRGSASRSLNSWRWADLSRRIFSLVDAIASLIPVIVAGGTSIIGIAVGLEGGRSARVRRGRAEQIAVATVLITKVAHQCNFKGSPPPRSEPERDVFFSLLPPGQLEAHV